MGDRSESTHAESRRSVAAGQQGRERGPTIEAALAVQRRHADLCADDTGCSVLAEGMGRHDTDGGQFAVHPAPVDHGAEVIHHMAEERWYVLLVFFSSPFRNALPLTRRSRFCRFNTANRHDSERLGEDEDDVRARRHAEDHADHSHARRGRRSDDTCHDDDDDRDRYRQLVLRRNAQARDEPDRSRKAYANTDVLFARRDQEPAIRADDSGAGDRTGHGRRVLHRDRQLPRYAGSTCVRANEEPARATSKSGRRSGVQVRSEVQRSGSRPLDQVLTNTAISRIALDVGVLSYI